MVTTNGFFSPYSAKAPYWIIANGPNAVALSSFGGQPLYHNAELYGVKVAPPWVSTWNQILAEYAEQLGDSGHEIAVISAETTPSFQEIELSLRSIDEIDNVAKSLWLVNHLEAKELICFMQSVVDRDKREVGAEAFARIETTDGKLIEGAAIMNASHALHLEYQVDRLMHKQAIACFVDAGLAGLVFVNFLTGFIHRPEVYLDGLNNAVDYHGLSPGSVVLDISLPGYSKDVAKLESIAEYCRTRGFLMALDDVSSATNLAPLLRNIKPAFVKLDAKLAPLMLDTKQQYHVTEIIQLAHAEGTKVVAENVESETLYLAYHAADVDMFQGYFLGAPARCNDIKMKK